MKLGWLATEPRVSIMSGYVLTNVLESKLRLSRLHACEHLTARTTLAALVVSSEIISDFSKSSVCRRHTGIKMLLF